MLSQKHLKKDRKGMANFTISIAKIKGNGQEGVVYTEY